MRSCGHCRTEVPCAAKVGIFQHLDAESMEKITAIAIHRNYRKGDILFSPDENHGLYLIGEGKVKVYEISPSGKEQLLRVLSKGDFAGETALFDSQESFAFGEAVTDVAACYVRREDFIELLMRFPSISLKLLEEFSRRMNQADHHTTANTVESVMERITAYLLELTKAQESNVVELPMSMKELAAFVSTTPETLSRRMKTLEEQGFLRRSGRVITILKPQN